MSDSPHDSTDQRDERLAALLQPAPLDEVTRARLVHAAMDASEAHTEAAQDETPRSRSRARWFAVAAAVVLVIAVGITTVITRDDAGSGPTAARASRPPTLPFESTTDLTISPEALRSAELRIIDTQVALGDLGDVGTNAKLPARGRGCRSRRPSLLSFRGRPQQRVQVVGTGRTGRDHVAAYHHHGLCRRPSRRDRRCRNRDGTRQGGYGLRPETARRHAYCVRRRRRLRGRQARKL